MPAPKPFKPRLLRGLIQYEPGGEYHYKFRRRKKLYQDTTGCRSRAAAEAWLKEFRDRLALQEMGILASAPPPTLADACDEWVTAHVEAVGLTHRNQMSTTIHRHLKAWKHLRLDEVTTKHLEAAQAEFLSNPATLSRNGKEWYRTRRPGGWLTLMKMLRRLYNWSIQARDWIKEIPWEAPTADVTQQQDRPVVWKEDWEAFLAEVDAHWDSHVQIAVRLQLLGGLREGEALGFDWRWMDWRREVYMPYETKNRETREVPIRGDLLDRLRGIWTAAGRPAAGFALLSRSQGIPHHRGFTNKPVREAGAALKIMGLHPHRLRASFATGMWETGATIGKIQQILGHADPETTDGYIKRRVQDAALDVDKLLAVTGQASSITVPLAPLQVS